jgi:hypothetical protein
MPTNVPVFISFDYDHDLDLKNLLVGQAKYADSPFFIEDWSVKLVSADWRVKARTRIRRANQMIVICGQHTSSAAGVNAEIKIAREEGTPYFLLRGRALGRNVKPTAALTTDKIHEWTWPNLKLLIAGRR